MGSCAHVVVACVGPELNRPGAPTLVVRKRRRARATHRREHLIRATSRVDGLGIACSPGATDERLFEYRIFDVPAAFVILGLGFTVKRHIEDETEETERREV